MPGENEDYAFGQSLAAGDFNGDGYDDLAIGVPGEDITEGTTVKGDAGMVCVLHGSSAGLDPDFRTLSVTDDAFGPSSVSETGDQLGFALAAGDCNGDGIDDLAAGAPGENYTSTGRGITFFDSGAVLVLLGTASGLTDTGSQFLSEETSGIGAAEDLDAFGAALAFVDANGDGFAELAIGIPGEDATVTGAVYILGAHHAERLALDTTRTGRLRTANR